MHRAAGIAPAATGFSTFLEAYGISIMSHSDIARFQAQMASGLSRVHGGVETRTEWSTMGDQVDSYSPRLDIAVGPFAVGSLRYRDRFDELLERHGGFLRRAYDFSNANFDEYGEGTKKFAFADVTRRNWNSRCFLAIEIENKVTRKHLMGGAVNAAALGRVGIAVGWTSDKVRALVKLRTYLLYLGRVGKNTFEPINLLVLSPLQVRSAVRISAAS